MCSCAWATRSSHTRAAEAAVCLRISANAGTWCVCKVHCRVRMMPCSLSHRGNLGSSLIPQHVTTQRHDAWDRCRWITSHNVKDEVNYFTFASSRGVVYILYLKTYMWLVFDRLTQVFSNTVQHFGKAAKPCWSYLCIIWRKEVKGAVWKNWPPAVLCQTASLQMLIVADVSKLAQLTVKLVVTLADSETITIIFQCNVAGGKLVSMLRSVDTAVTQHKDIFEITSNLLLVQILLRKYVNFGMF